MLISDIIFKVLLHKKESLMRICAKSLYPAPLLDIEITAKQVLEEIQAVLILVKIVHRKNIRQSQMNNIHQQ